MHLFVVITLVWIGLVLATCIASLCTQVYDLIINTTPSNLQRESSNSDTDDEYMDIDA